MEDGYLEIQAPVSSSGIWSIINRKTALPQTFDFSNISPLMYLYKQHLRILLLPLLLGVARLSACRALLQYLPEAQFANNIDSRHIAGPVSFGGVDFPAGTISFENSGPTAFVVFVERFNQSGSTVLSIVNNSPLPFNIEFVTYYFGVCSTL